MAPEPETDIISIYTRTITVGDNPKNLEPEINLPDPFFLHPEIMKKHTSIAILDGAEATTGLMILLTFQE